MVSHQHKTGGQRTNMSLSPSAPALNLLQAKGYVERAAPRDAGRVSNLESLFTSTTPNVTLRRMQKVRRPGFSWGSGARPVAIPTQPL